MKYKAAIIYDTRSLFNTIKIIKDAGTALDYNATTKVLEANLELITTYKCVLLDKHNKNSINFYTMLSSNNFDICIGRELRDYKLALKCVDIMQSVDAFVFVSSCQKDIELSKWLKSKGKITIFANLTPQKQFAEGCNIQYELTAPECFRRRGKIHAPIEAAKPVELPSDINSDVIGVQSEIPF